MGGAARKIRVQRLEEDADIPSLVYVESTPTVPLWPEMGETADEFTTPMDDAFAHAVDASETWPPFVCDCGTHNEGRDLACHYCGAWREDVDQCA